MDKKKKISGVYETLRSFKGKFVLLPEHQKRMEQSCKELGLPVPDLAEIAKEFESADDKDVRLRVAVDLNGNVEVKNFDLPRWHGSFLYDEVWKVKMVYLERVRPDLKSTNIQGQLDAREEAAKEGYGEILLVDEDGFIREGGITNVFFVEDKKIVTPGEGMLPGISRELILKACEELGIEVELRAVHEDELKDFDFVFLSNSIRGMVPTGPISPLMQKIANWCTDFILKKL